MIGIRVPEIPFVLVQAASGIHVRLLQESGNLVQLSSRYPADVEQAVAVVGIQHFYDVREVLFAGKVEVHFPQVGEGVAYGTPDAVDDERVGVYRQVAEAGHQHAEEEEAGSEGGTGGKEAPRIADAGQVEA